MAALKYVKYVRGLAVNTQKIRAGAQVTLKTLPQPTPNQALVGREKERPPPAFLLDMLPRPALGLSGRTFCSSPLSGVNQGVTGQQGSLGHGGNACLLFKPWLAPKAAQPKPDRRRRETVIFGCVLIREYASTKNTRASRLLS